MKAIHNIPFNAQQDIWLFHRKISFRIYHSPFCHNIKREKSRYKFTHHNGEVKEPSGPQLLVGGPSGLWTSSFVPSALRQCDPHTPARY